MNNNIVTFSYAGLAADVETRLRQTADAIRSSARNQVNEVLATGAALDAAKKSLPHGQFGPWLSSEFGWTERTAQRYMLAAKMFGSNPTRVSHFPINVVYRLASLPPDLRDRILSAAGTGAIHENEIAGLIHQEVRDKKQADCDAQISPEVKQKKAAREKARRKKWEIEKQARDRKETEDRDLARTLIIELQAVSSEAFLIFEKLMTGVDAHFVYAEYSKLKSERAKGEVT